MAGIQKAKPNSRGSTEPARHIDDNAASSKPGPRPDRFSLQKELERVRLQGEQNEAGLAYRKEIELEKVKSTEAMMELLAVEPASEKKARDERIRKLASRKRSDAPGQLFRQ